MCVCEDENGDEKFMENLFFEKFCYNTYVKDIYDTNKLAHYELFLNNNGFKITEIGDYNITLNRSVKNEMKNMKIENDDNLFNSYIKSSTIEKSDNKYENIHERANILKLSDKDENTLNMYKDILINEHKFTEHLNIIKIFKSDLDIDVKLEKINNETYHVKSMDSIYTKIKLLRTLENKLNIQKLDVNYESDDLINNISDDEWLFIKQVFRSTRHKPKNMNEFKPYIYN